MGKNKTRLEKFYLVAGALIIFGCGGVVWHVLHPAEPHYHGKPLSVWLRQHYDYFRLDPESAQSKEKLAEADNAIRQIGAQALPVLLKMAASEQTPPKTPARFYFWATFQSRFDPHALSETGFQVLGPIAKPAVPDLLNLLNDQNPDLRINAAVLLGEIGPSAEDAVPDLIKHLADTNAYVEAMAIIALGHIHGKPALAVPALLPYLAKTPMPDYNALEVIGEFGGDAKAAIPVLTNLLVHPQLNVRRYATNALKAIAPDAILKAKVK
jgi:HEAT repeat protein